MLAGMKPVYFGWWNWGVQMSLALAAGIALPLLAWLGYVPGQGGAACQPCPLPTPCYPAF